MSSSEMTRGSDAIVSPTFSVASEWRNGCSGVDRALRPAGPPAGDRGEHVGGGLDRRALHVVQHAADAAELLAAAGATGAAVDEHRQGRAVAGRLGGVVAVEHQDAAVPRREAEHERAGDGRVVGDDRADERPLAARGQGDRLVERVVRHHGRHRAEGLDVVGLDRTGAGPEQHRRHERAALRVTGEARGARRVAEDDVGRRAQRLDGLADLLALAERGERAHPHGLVAGVADGDRRRASPRSRRSSRRRRPPAR